MAGQVEPKKVTQARRLLEALYKGEEQTLTRFALILDHLGVNGRSKKRALSRLVLSQAKLLED